MTSNAENLGGENGVGELRRIDLGGTVRREAAEHPREKKRALPVSAEARALWLECLVLALAFAP